MLIRKENAVLRRFGKEILLVEAYGKGLRVRATERREFLQEDFGTLIPAGTSEIGRAHV